MAQSYQSGTILWTDAILFQLVNYPLRFGQACIHNYCCATFWNAKLINGFVKNITLPQHASRYLANLNTTISNVKNRMIRLIYPGENERRRGQVKGMQEQCLDIQKQWHKPNPPCQTFCYPYYTMAKALRRGKKNGEKENIHDFMTVSDCHRVSSLFAVEMRPITQKIIHPNSKQQHFFPLVFWHLRHGAHLAILSWFGVTLDSRQHP